MERDGGLRRAPGEPVDAATDAPLLGGWAPLVVVAALLVLMVLLTPTVAPERITARPSPSSTVPAP